MNSTTSTSATSTPTLNRRRQLVTGTVGHLVEYFDWSAYSFLAIYFAHQFFPGEDGSVVPLLSTFAVFAVGFLARPVGGVVLGRIADKHGRKTALTLSVALMGAGSLLIGVAPTYGQVGMLAPIVLVLARLIQGFSTGGELATASAFLMESAPSHRRGLYTSFTYVSSSVGKVFCLALITALVHVVGNDATADWAWRVPFLIGAAGAVVAWWIRRHAEETYERSEEPTVPTTPFRELAKNHGPSLRRAFVLCSITSAMFYTWTTFIPTWAVVTAGGDKESAVLVSTVAFCFYGVIQIPLGALSDKIGRRPMIFVFTIGNAALTVPLFMAISSSAVRLLLIQCAGMLITSCLMSVSGAVIGEMFPARVRVLATGTAISVATAVFGGTVPTIGTALHSIGQPILFPFYLVVLNLLALLVLARTPETAHSALPR